MEIYSNKFENLVLSINENGIDDNIDVDATDRKIEDFFEKNTDGDNVDFEYEQIRVNELFMDAFLANPEKFIVRNNYDRYYHGSHDDSICKIDIEEGFFNGMFFSRSSGVAESHGDNIYFVELRKDEILTQQELSYDIDYKKVEKIIKKQIGKVNKNEFHAIWEIIAEDRCVFDFDLEEKRICEIFKCVDIAEASWTAQKIRGIVAKKMGYKAVEMDDEHGRTYLVVSDLKLSKLE